MTSLQVSRPLPFLGGAPHPHQGCKKFLLACELYLTDYPELSDRKKISFITQQLTRQVMDWATAVWSGDGIVTSSYNRFIHAFRVILDHPVYGKTEEQQLLRLKQGHLTVADYAIKFRISPAESEWCSKSLLACIRDGLQPEIQLELACRDSGFELDECIELK